MKIVQMEMAATTLLESGAEGGGGNEDLGRSEGENGGGQDMRAKGIGADAPEFCLGV